MTTALTALEYADFDWVKTLDSVWSDADPTTGGPNDRFASTIVGDLVRDFRRPEKKSLGRVLVGEAGIGKTHLVGRMRREIWSRGGWFVLLDMLGLQNFWRSAALSYVTALLHHMPDGRRQLEAVLAGVARSVNIEEPVEAAFGRTDLRTVELVDVFHKALVKIDQGKAHEFKDVFRALCFLRSHDQAVAGLAHSWLQGIEVDIDQRSELHFDNAPPEPARIVAGLSWIMSIAGPTLVALDQVDGIIDASQLSEDDAGDGKGFAEILAAGIVEMHDVRHRGMTVMTCLFDSWIKITSRGGKPFVDRFMGSPITLSGMNDKSAAIGLVASRLAPAFAEADYAPPYPTYPFAVGAIEKVASSNIMPRTLLMRCDAFRRNCINWATVTECRDLTRPIDISDPPTPPVDIDLEAEKRRVAVPDIRDADDTLFGQIVRGAFDLFALEETPAEDIDIANKGDPEQKIAPLHGRLTYSFVKKGGEYHVCYRALPHTNAIAFSTRLKAALTGSGIPAGIPGRKLVIARRGAPPTGAKTRELFDNFIKYGGIIIDPSDDDLRTFAALQEMRASCDTRGNRENFETWLRLNKPVRATAFFEAAGLGRVSESPSGPGPAGGLKTEAPKPAASKPGVRRGPPPPPPAPEPSPAASTAPPPAPPRAPDDRVHVGRFGDGAPAEVRVDLLPRHTAILAGSGSGKTVLLRRLIEEAALLGVPSVVVDPNNDLSRLGDPWPERPATFTAEDDAKAAAYARDVEVVVWTPGARAGNPLFLSVLPDFAALRDDPDERDAAVEMAAEALGPLSGAKNQNLRGVLYGALRAFARRGGGDLKAFTALLADLPEGASEIGNAPKLAAALADGLRAAVETNPLLRVDGPVLDPATLFAGPDPARTRVSVVNLAALGSDAAREDFVNRLQMAVFGFIKRHPSERGRLYAVDEAQTFLPSTGRTPASLGSGRRLAAQARKYGLGLVVATQAPKGIDTQIVSNCTTQFFGRQSSPATIGGAADMMNAKGGAAPDIGKLSRGQFYFATEGMGRPRRIETPLCLTHHPANPPSPEEVVARAGRGSADRL